MQEDTQAPLLTRHGSSEPDIAARTVRKLDRRVLLLSVGVVFLAFVDRGNIGYAAKALCGDLRMNHEEYGMGVSLFYAGYLCTQVLSNMMLKRVGAPIWLACILSAWGCAAAGMGLLQNKTQFYILRFVLGLAEGGAYPGVNYYLTLFYPDGYLSGAYSVVTAALVISMPISSPVSAGLLTLDGLFGMEGWRFLFIVEGLLPIAYAAVLYNFLPRSPEQSSFLLEEEKDWIATERSKQPMGSDASLWEDLVVIFGKKAWWYLTASALIGFAVDSCLMFWVTLMIDDMLYGDDDDDSKACGSNHGGKAAAVLLTAIPYVFAAVLVLIVRWYLNKNPRSDRSKLVAGTKMCAGLFLISWVGTKELSFSTGLLSLILAIGFSHCAGGGLAGLVVGQYDHSVRPSVTAVFNTSISIGPFIFPHITGALLDSYGYGAGNIFLGSFLVLAGILVAFVVDPLTSVEIKHGADSPLPPDC